LFVAAFLPLAAGAQEVQGLRDRDPDLASSKKVVEDLARANFHRGPFYLLSRLQIADAGYTEAAYLPTGDSEAGLSLTVNAPQRLYFVPSKKAIFSLDLVPGYSFFNGDSGRNQFNYLGRADAHFLFNHLYLNAYTLRADQLRAHVADLNRLATTRTDETGAAAEWKYSSRTSALFSAARRTYQYPSDRYQPIFDELDFNPVQLLERDENNARVALTHKTFPLTSLFLSAEGSDYQFRNATFKDSRRLWYGGGVSYDSGRTGIRLEVAALSLTFSDKTQHSYQGLGGTLSATRTNGRWTYAGRAGRDLGFSVFLANNYYVASTADAEISYIANRRLTLRTGVVYEQDDYETPVHGIERRDQTSFSSVGFLLTFRRLLAGVDGGWYERKSNYDVTTDSGIRYVLHLSFNP